MMTPMLASCETFKDLIGANPAELKPSTFCEIYAPVRAPGERDSPEWRGFWDYLANQYPEQSKTIRGNNAVYVENCS